MPPSEGNVTISGYDVLDEPLLTKNKIGYLPETPPLYLDMTVSEYLNFAGLLKQVPNQKINAAVDNACSKVDINDVKNKVIKALSKGYKQRVGLAQAIIHDPEVLILDEPTIGLDPIQIREVRDLIKSLAGNHTIVLSTHILPEVDMTCDEVVIIKKGKIIAQDTPKNLSKKMNKSSLEEIFIDLISESGLEKK